MARVSTYIRRAAARLGENFLRENPMITQAKHPFTQPLFTRPLSQQAKLEPSFDITKADRLIEVSNKSGAVSLTYEYLLDNNARTFDPKTYQRLDNPLIVDPNLELLNWKLLDGDNLELNWSNEQSTVFDLSFMNTISSEAREVFWNSGQFEDLVLSQAVDANGLFGPDGKKFIDDFHRCLDKFGVAFVKNVEPSVVGTERVCEQVGIISRNYYSDKTWLLSANMEQSDTAYSNIPLRAHTDTTYFDTPLGIQVFHLLSHNGTGGETLLVDGFNIASLIHQMDQESYETLRGVSINYRYIEPGRAIFEAN